MLEAQIAAVAQQFAREAIKLENLKVGTGARLSLDVKLGGYGSDKSPKITLGCTFYSGDDYNTVTAGSLGALMDEVHRRCGFADKQALVMDRNNAALTALEAPKPRGFDHVDKTDKWDMDGGIIENAV
jgi:hypothetical protein